MRAFLVLTEAEPKIVVPPREIVADCRLAENLSQAGVDRFRAHEIAVDRLRETPGVPFEVIETDVKNGKGLRVLESNGRHLLARVQLTELGLVFAHDL
jgi:hypothetical protein